MMRSESAAEETTRESLDPGMDEMYGGRRSFSVSPAGQRPRSIHGAMGGGEQGIVEHLFFTLGEGIGRYAVAFTLLTICGCAALTSGIWLRGSVDTELFNSLVLRPKSRMQRETNYNVNRYDAGYASASEVTNAVADEGGKDVLTRKNLLQTARFWRDKDVLGVAVSEGGEEYSGRDVLVITAGTSQPIRYTLLDCWQEGAYDHFGSIGDLDPAAAQLEYLAYEALAPFDAEAAAAAYAAPPFVTPYAYCLYMRLVLLYTPAGVDVSLFGRCRQFLDEEPTADDAALAALKDAYDFHRFYLYDFMASKPSLYLAWACLAPFASEPAGRCHAGYTCCEIATIYSGCASGALDEATCAGYAAALGATTWYENPTFSAAYAAEAPCGDFGFYPLSSAFAAQAFGTTASYPTPTTFDDCAARYAVYAATPAADVEALVDAATRNALCQPAGANVCAALSASDTNLLWSSNIATDAEITATAVSGTCALWDGGAEGMGILPYVPLTLTVGDFFDAVKNKGLQFVYLSNGYKTIKRAKAAGGASASDGDAEAGRKAWLLKYNDHVAGRYAGGSMVHGTYSSEILLQTLEDASIIDVELLALGYVLVIAYAGTAMLFEVTGGYAMVTHVCVGCFGVLLVICGLAASLGVACFLGIPFNAVSVQVLPFLLVGLGVNDMFLLAHNYCDVEKEHGASKAAPALVGYMLGRSGPSITLTTCANFVAFIRLAGDLPAERRHGLLRGADLGRGHRR